MRPIKATARLKLLAHSCQKALSAHRFCMHSRHLDRHGDGCGIASTDCSERFIYGAAYAGVRMTAISAGE